MKSDYKIQGKLATLTLQVEEGVAQVLLDMEKHSKHTSSELANTALKRFITHHKDFLPANYRMPSGPEKGN
jgi:hypothetical protein